MEARNRRTGAPIIAIVDQVLGNTGVTDIGFELDEHGRVAVEHDESGTKLCWETCKVYQEKGGHLFLDSNRENIGECDIELFDPETGTVKRPVIDRTEADLETLAQLKSLAERRRLRIPPGADTSAMLDSFEEAIRANST